MMEEQNVGHGMVSAPKSTKFGEVLNEMLEVYKRKNHDYGDSFSEAYDEFGLLSAVVRMGDKYRRLKTLVSNNGMMAVDESIEDTLLDLANYAVMSIVEIRSRR